MFYFTADTITQANKKIKELDAKTGGLLCILHCLPDSIEENVSYKIDGEILRKQLNFVFDKTPKDFFDNAKSSYIIFAKDWANTFFTNFIKNRIDLLSCAVFFLRRYGFEREYTNNEVIEIFIDRFNLKNYKDSWFINNSTLKIEYNQKNVEENQIEFYHKMQYFKDFKSILFDGVIQKSAADLKAAGQIQTLYSGSSVQKCFLLSNEPLDQYYIMRNAQPFVNNQTNGDGVPVNSSQVNGTNVLYYGVPGTGKSYTIKQTYHPTVDNSERVVFHPDYTYSDFVGQILPETKKDDNGNDIISYPFTPGPFTRILKKASKEENKDKPFYLIIEEINRGNAPAIFGEIFQLLDRYDETDAAGDPSVNIGESAYSINNADIAKEVYGDSEHPVKIPANLFILATMNTADQNVFTLDTAFKRRWTMKSIKNNINNCYHANNHICGRNVTWAKFATEINNRILEYGEGNLSSEDNRLGAYFVKANELNDSSAFAEKVLMYLWNDAFKFDREKVFKSQYKSLEQLIDGFEDNAFDVFVDSFEFDNSKINNNEPNTADADDNDTDNAEISVSDYYEGKNQQMVELCQNLITDLSDTIDDMIVGARANYIALRLPGNNRPKNVVEIHIKRDKISLHIKEPSNAEYQIGELLPDNYRWSLNYRIDFVNSDNLNQIVEILQDSFANMR